MTPILIGACDCASPAVVTIAAATRATRTIHRVAIGRLLRDVKVGRENTPGPGARKPEDLRTRACAGIFFVETRGGRLGHASAGPEMGEQFGAAYSEAVCGR